MFLASEFKKKFHTLLFFFRERSDEDLEEYYRRKYVETSRKYAYFVELALSHISGASHGFLGPKIKCLH